MHRNINLLVTLVFLLGRTVIAAELSLFDELALELNNVRYLEQNWESSDRDFFYYTDQGSRLLPYDFFLNLEQAGNQELFRSPANMLCFGFIPGLQSSLNPDGLAVGFTRNGDYMGPTCAACHTQQIKYAGKVLRIDGGQAMVDFPLFLNALTLAMQATLADEIKFRRFYERILGNKANEKAIAKLRSALRETYLAQKDYNRRNLTDVPYGFSRLDAFGAILNKGLHLTGVKDNFNPPDAPTSYPYLWDTPQHDYVEWNGSQTNSSLGALARNVGEVIGVFGHIEVRMSKWLGFIDAGYPSSIEARNLRQLEKVVAKLQSPMWPVIFPELDGGKTIQGRELFEKHCQSCHLDIDRRDPNRLIKVRMSSIDKVKTDPLMALNTVELRGRSGKLLGKPRFYAAGELLEEEAPALYIVNNIMGGVLKNNAIQVLLAKRDAEALGHPEELHPPKYLDGKVVERGKEVANETLLAYKARPLNGIWATAPYMHNGSIPNLYETLIPASERSAGFYIGTLEYDTEKVGYVSTATDNAFYFDTTLKGNSNAGHEYFGGDYGEEPFSTREIEALLEYLKTL